MELGAGPGVAGLIAARVARKCYLTDYHDEVYVYLENGIDIICLRVLEAICTSVRTAVDGVPLLQLAHRDAPGGYCTRDIPLQP